MIASADVGRTTDRRFTPAANVSGTGTFEYTVSDGSIPTDTGEKAVVDDVLNPLENPWIGARDDANDTDAIFDWVTDDPFTFTQFAAGQPDDDAGLGGNGECLHIVNAAGEWNDTNCDITTFVVGQLCEIELEPCGDSILQTSNLEECDDSNQTPNDGCSATCQLEVGCGNGITDVGEECDDNNIIDGDTCSFPTCQLLQGCGDGNLDAGEQCDDDNLADSDGCSATCTLENLVRFSFTGSVGNEVTFAADAGSLGLSGIPAMIRGAGVTPSNNAGTFSAVDWTATPTAEPTDFFSFTVTPDTGFTTTLQILELDERRSGTGIRQWTVRSSLDSFASDLQVFAVPDDTNTRTSQRIVLGPAFTNLSTAVEFRIFGFEAEAAGGSWRIDNVEVFGFTTGP